MNLMRYFGTALVALGAGAHLIITLLVNQRKRVPINTAFASIP